MLLKGIEMLRYDVDPSRRAIAVSTLQHIRSGLLGVSLVCGSVLLGASGSFAAPAVVLGDSIGVGVSMAGGVPRLAHNSVSIRSADVVRQLKRLSPGTVAFLSLGTNDAVGSISGVERGVDKILQTARTGDLRLVWIGPPCVLKPWNANVAKLDTILSRRLSGQVPYVSIADQQLCDKSLRGADGVHFNMRGYSILWARARAAAGVGIESGQIQPDVQGERKNGVHKMKPQEGRRPGSEALADGSSNTDVSAALH
jgi:lysophospholipase L1-like esterase